MVIAGDSLKTKNAGLAVRTRRCDQGRSQRLHPRIKRPLLFRGVFGAARLGAAFRARLCSLLASASGGAGSFLCSLAAGTVRATALT